ncbi:MAG: hypothetical protein ABGY28_02115 [bacterium]
MLYSTDKQKAIAVHEAGHAVVAVSEMLPIICATIQPTKEYSGCVFFKDPPIHIANEKHRRFSAEKQRTYLEAHALSSLAGSIAEFEHYYRTIRKPKPKKWIRTNQGAREDRHQASEWIVRLVGSEEELQLYTEWLFQRAKQTVTLYWKQIQAVQEALLQHTTLTGKDVKQAVRETFEGKLRSR